MSESKLQKVQEQLEAYRRRKQAEEEANKPKEVPTSSSTTETDKHLQQEEPKLNKFDYFAIDVLNIYPMRKWREWSSTDPYRCWAATGCFWLAGQILAGHAQFGIVYFIFSLFIFLFLNLGSRKEGELSAYSVFNPNCERLLGSLTAEQFERDMMIRRNE
uniref:SAYSvFN domain-containing protein n=1 Tax=Panagrolaimus sp. PS1159 TaxID=55785 RepID=A0AC35EZB3_9BILA